uniref:Cytochrome P450 family 4 n=1 Tax=Pinctada imbricata TaxID=66713 RepID=A0A0E3DAN0_PINIB|nr:cytochrome P450 family 4 [Pinctada imbricata]
MICSFLFTVLAAIIAYKIIFFLLEWRKKIEICKNMPSIGPRHWLWGHLNMFSSTAERAKLERKMLERTGAKIFVTWLGPFSPLISVCHPDTAKLLFKSSEPKSVFKPPGVYYFIKSWLGMGLLLSYDKNWERNRRLLTPAFHFDILKPYVKIYNSVADTFLKNIHQNLDSNNNVELYSLVSLATLDTMLRCAFSYEGGVQTHRSHPYAVAVKRLATLARQRHFNPLLHSEWMYSLSKSGREWKNLTDYVHKFAEEIITSRQKSLKEDPQQLDKRYLDFLDILITAKGNDGSVLSDEEIRAEVDTFLFEGHDTTASAISWAAYYLGKHPEEQQKVYEEVKNITNCEDNFTWENINNCPRLALFLKEAMRQSSSVPIIARQLTKPFEFDGFEIPAGMAVDIWIYHINNHPNVWPDNEVFRPERFLDSEVKERDPYAYVPFSAGPRNCIGQKFAQDEEKVIMARLLLRYKISLVPDFEYVPEFALVMRAENGIKLHIEERK